MSAEPSVMLDPPQFERHAGSVLEGRVVLPDAARCPHMAVELSLRWDTDGKGTREGEVVGRWSLYRSDEPPPSSLAFRVGVPWAPWSFQGALVKIRWTLRLAVMTDGFERSWDQPFVVLPPGLDFQAQPYRGGSARETAR